MNDTAICTDSSALLPGDVAERLGINVVPLSLQLDGEAFDERSGDVDDFYARLENGAQAKTSQPNLAAFADAYAQAARLGRRHVLSIHLDARISGTSHSAELAALEAEIPVTVVDTTTASFGVGVCVRAAARALASGAAPAEGARSAVNLGAQMQNAFVAPGGPSGRVTGSTDWTVLTLADGVSSPVRGCESVDEALEAMAARIHEEGRSVRAAVGHAGSVVEDPADRLAHMIARAPNVEGVERYRVGPSVGAHTGPVSFGVFWWPAAS